MKFQTLVEQKTNRKGDVDKLVNANLVQLNKLYTRSGFQLRIVGGAVRDILSGKEPKDIDLASDATPEESLRLLKDNDIRVIETGLQHGTVTAHIDGEDYEITSLRIDRETDGRHAKVEYTRDWEVDAERRDLTFNAMSMDFDGNLYDYFGGHEDLKKGTARFVGDTEKRIQEDYLRILRYFRFQSRMKSPKIDSDTIGIIKTNADGLQSISGERIWSEVSKILPSSKLMTVIKSMRDARVLDNIGLSKPNLKELAKVRRNTDNPNLLIAAMLNSVDELDQLRSRWKFSNPEYNTMKFVIQNRSSIPSLREARKKHILQRIDKSLLADLFEYDGKRDLKNKILNWNPQPFPVTGDDLKAVGVSPGLEMGKLLQDLKQKWVDSEYKLSKSDLLSTIS